MRVQKKNAFRLAKQIQNSGISNKPTTNPKSMCDNCESL